MVAKKDKVGNVPNLRFPGFDGNWDESNLGDLCKMKAGKFVSATDIYEKYKESLFPCYGGNGLRGYTKSYNQDGFFSLIGRQGALCGNVVFVAGKFHATEHAVVVIPKNNVDTRWMYHLLVHLNLNQYATGAAQPGLSVQNLQQVESKIPTSNEEQRKISSFLEFLDRRIKTQSKIIQRLETSMQNLRASLFTQKIRFKDNFGKSFAPWKTKKLGDIATRITEKNKEDNKNVLTISAQHGLISQLDFFNKSVSAKDLTGYFLLKKNDFAYNKSYSNGYPMGAIKRLKYYEKGVVSTLYICLGFNSDIDLDFMEHLLETGIQNSELEKIAQEGARNHGLLNIGLADFFNIKLNIPSLDEQNYIGNFLYKLKEKIMIEKQLLLKYEHQKKYLLQKLFI